MEWVDGYDIKGRLGHWETFCLDNYFQKRCSLKIAVDLPLILIEYFDQKMSTGLSIIVIEY